jgi:hypothetical protein
LLGVSAGVIGGFVHSFFVSSVNSFAICLIPDRSSLPLPRSGSASIL